MINLDNILIYISLTFVIAFIPTIVLKDIFRDRRILIYLFFLIFMIVIPFIGIILTIALTLAIKFIHRSEKELDIRIIYMEDYFQSIPNVKRRFGEGALKEMANSENIPLNLAMGALALLAEHPTSESFSVIKRLTANTNDEIRLFSFSIIDKIEHRINDFINDELKRFGEYKENTKEYFNSAKKLAFAYWKLVSLELADEILTAFLLEKVKHYAEIALKNGEEDLKLYTLLGQAYFKTEDYEKAKEYLEVVVANKDISKERDKIEAIPYLAEIEFIKENYKRVKTLMREGRYLKFDKRFRAIWELWRK